MIEVRREPFRGPHYEAILGLRSRVLREPLGRTLDPAGDERCVFFVALEGDMLVGTVQLDGTRLRQMAVSPDRQKQGIGERLVAALEADAREHGISHIELHAREVARGFYAKLGYVPEGDPFEEIGIPHVVMTKKL